MANLKRSQPTLQHFFTKEPRINKIEVEIKYESLDNSDQALEAPRPSHKNQSTTHSDEYDIGHGWSSITDARRLHLLRNSWVPPTDYIFPTIGPRKLKFQPKWFHSFNWPAYTKNDGKGAVCKCCVLFAKHFVGKNAGQKTGLLVSKPFKNWKKALERFRDHENTCYHKEAVLFADDYINSQKASIMDKIDDSREVVRKASRDKLAPIIETSILCGRQSLAIRGTMDSGLMDLNAAPMHNEGNFRALLRMRALSGDKLLKAHIESAARNATHMSSEIQNEILVICGKMMQSKIVEKVNEARGFSLLADETTDVSGVDQLSICVRYVEENIGKLRVREDFLCFAAVASTTGELVASTLLSTLSELGIDTKYLIGQGYDGAAAMSGQFKGVQAIIRQTHKAAIYVHCAAHTLNLAICESCQVQAIRNCIGTVKAVGKFYTHSAKRIASLTRHIRELSPVTKWTRLTKMCEARWVENHDGLIRFKEIYAAIARSLKEFTNNPNIETSSKATHLLFAISNTEFVIALSTSEALLSLTVNLSKSLQTVECDLQQACDHVATIYELVKDKRKDIENVFHSIYTDASRLLNEIGEDIKVPRIVGHQVNRANVVTSTPEQFYRITIAVPYMDEFLSQLSDRFMAHRQIISELYLLLPHKCNSITKDWMIKNLKIYESFIEIDRISAEISIWQKKWSMQTSVPKNAVEAMESCERSLFPNLHFLLKVLAAMPISTSTPERSFSSLRRLKPYLRNATGEERLTALALLSTHRDITLDADEALEKFCSDHPRKLLL